MSAARAPSLDRRWLAPVGAGALLLLGFLDPYAVLRGLHAAFLVALAVPAGAMLLLLIHRCTGGRWGEAAAPLLRLACSLLPAASLLVLPVLFDLAAVFPWAADASQVRTPAVAALYLNAPSFVARALLALGLWNALAALAAFRPARLTKPLAGLGLALFGLTVSYAAFDWVIALDPRFKSTAFAMSWSVAFLLSGAGFAAAAGVAEEVRSDFSKLVATFALGLLYLDLMQFIVGYTGNLPDVAVWYGRRATPAGTAAITAAFALAGLVPFLPVMRREWRVSPSVQRLAGICAVAGVAIRTAWWAAPELDPTPVFWLAAFAGLVLVSGLAETVRRRPDALPPRFRRRLSHGA